MSFYNSLNLTLFYPLLLPSPFTLLSFSFLEFLFSCLPSQSHCIGTLSLYGNFLKVKLDYKLYMYMLNIIHTYIHIYIYIYIYMVVSLVSHQNAKSTTVRHIGRCWHLETPLTIMPYTSGGAL